VCPSLTPSVSFVGIGGIARPEETLALSAALMSRPPTLTRNERREARVLTSTGRIVLNYYGRLDYYGRLGGGRSPCGIRFEGSSSVLRSAIADAPTLPFDQPVTEEWRGAPASAPSLRKKAKHLLAKFRKLAYGVPMDREMAMAERGGASSVLRDGRLGAAIRGGKRGPAPSLAPESLSWRFCS